MLKVFLFCLLVTISFLCFLQKAKEHERRIKLIERNEELYRDIIGVEKEYINSNQLIINRYEH
jgi:hypothetical protein